MPEFDVEIVLALPERQSLQVIDVAAGATVADVVAKSGLLEAYPVDDIGELVFGVWGREVDRDRIVQEGDRIEIYRPLNLDPQEARRQLALSGRTMSSVDPD